MEHNMLLPKILYLEPGQQYIAIVRTNLPQLRWSALILILKYTKTFPWFSSMLYHLLEALFIWVLFRLLCSCRGISRSALSRSWLLAILSGPLLMFQQIVMKRRENKETWGDVTKQDYNSLFHFLTCMMLIHWIVRCSPGHFILRSIVIAC